MITSKDLNVELKTLEDKVAKGEVTNVDIVKAICLVAKLLRDVRVNQVRGLEASGVKLIEPRQKDHKGETGKGKK